MNKLPRGLAAELGPAGRSLWRSLTKDVELQPHEAVLLVEACRTTDLLADLREAEPKVDPREIRLQQDILRKLLGQIDWPDDGPASRSSAGRAMAMARWNRGSKAG